MHVFSSGGACARPSFPCEVVASRDAFSPRSGSKPCLPDAVLPDVTRHGNFVSAPLDRCPPHKPSPRGEAAELCSPDAVLPDVTRHGSFVSAPLDRCPPPSLLPEEKLPNFVRRMPCCLTSRATAVSFLRRSTGARPQAFSPKRRCRTLFAGCRGSVPSPSSAFRRLPHFQSSMLLHNLSSVFYLGRKASQCALRSSRVLLRTIATARPAASPHQATPGSRPAPAPFPAAAGFPQSFPHFCRFPTAAFFPLGFLGERQRQIF